MKLIYSKFYCLEAFWCFKMWQKPVLGSEYGPPKNSPQFSTAFKYSRTVNGFLRHLSTYSTTVNGFLHLFLSSSQNLLPLSIYIVTLLSFFLPFPPFSTFYYLKTNKKQKERPSNNSLCTYSCTLYNILYYPLSTVFYMNLYSL